MSAAQTSIFRMDSNSTSYTFGRRNTAPPSPATTALRLNVLKALLKEVEVLKRLKPHCPTSPTNPTNTPQPTPHPGRMADVRLKNMLKNIMAVLKTYHDFVMKQGLRIHPNILRHRREIVSLIQIT